ncbi:Conserved hypothetical protein [Pseudomonas knackmussii B13]|uniref:Transposase IS200-like domain-containing protein n=1 Tax=Pseudomonas knackmussii (strain DSM 6978 / CCUG 54928 / LMG 23759 / B13) TaxID=1301098 RepID=A0A024HME8_PSEKB|nr:transposase [Pseudomonas knackmussii]CDF86036.1 Conserved hypothetical protein [Pseudomonas knackmussii B13]
MGFHGKNLRKGRHSIPGQIYLLTTVTADRERLFEDWSTSQQVCREIHATDCLQSLAWVLMPDHLHWLFLLNEGSLEQAMQRFKSRSAIIANTSSNRTGKVWQSGFHDRAIRREEDLKAVARYVIANPLRAGLVKRISDYPFWNAAWL